jgi:ATP/maltotriose-dependent transcriptional regulator MalT
MSPRAGWLLVNEILPRLRSAVPLVAHFVGAEDPEELIGDATLHAARILHSAEARNKTVSASSVAYYAIQHTKSGRRSVGNSCCDAMAAGTQLHGHSRLDSLEQVVASNEECGGEIWELHDVLASDQEEPATRAARKMDWSAFASALTERERAVIECIIEGRSLREVAKSFRVCDSTMQGDIRKLAVKIQDFMGVDILIEVRRSPRWKDDIMTSREQLACKHLRAH